MRLFHVSETSDIEAFEPRAGARGELRSLVWAVDADHLVNYMLPRECPRVCFRADARTTATDRRSFLGPSGKPVVAIGADWLARVKETHVWVYELPSADFHSEDVNAGYYVSLRRVVPLSKRLLERPAAEVVRAGAELRVVADLARLAHAVTNSSLAFSCIRLRNLEHP